MANQNLLIGGVVVLGAAAYFLTQNEGATTLEDTQATSYTDVSGDDAKDDRSQSIVSVSDLLGDCSTNDAGEETGGNTVNTCIAPLWSANESIKVEHPIYLDTSLPTAEREKYKQYYFTVDIDGDATLSMAESAWESWENDRVIGDYTISATRSGAWQESRRWTANQNADWNGNGVSETFPLTKGNAMNPANSVLPTWNECLAAFGGYMPNFVAALGDPIILRQGDFDDYGSFRYEKQGADGQPYPVSTNYYGLDMNGNEIPLYAQLQYRCGYGESWNNSGAKVQVTSANILPAGQECYSPCFPAVVPTSGVALGCSLPTVSITYPAKIQVYCDSFGGQDCSQVPTSVLGNKTYTEWWNLNPAITTPTSMQKGGWTTPSGAVWSKLFNAYGTPRVYSDSQGWYVYAGSGGTNNPTKHYINSVLPAFKAAYTRQSLTCTCPSDTNLDGQTFTVLDKSTCPGTGILGTYGGATNNEWKTTYCGGLKPVYGCKDARAINYNSNPDVVKDPDDTDVCNPKYCNYGVNQVLAECQGLGGGGNDLPGTGGGLGEAPADDTGDSDESPPSGGGDWGGGDYNPGTGGTQWGGGGTANVNIRMAENVIRPSKLINTSQSFLNW